MVLTEEEVEAIHWYLCWSELEQQRLYIEWLEMAQNGETDQEGFNSAKRCLELLKVIKKKTANK